jgi:hypothetical protein
MLLISLQARLSNLSPYHHVDENIDMIRKFYTWKASADLFVTVRLWAAMLDETKGPKPKQVEREHWLLEQNMPFMSALPLGAEKTTAHGSCTKAMSTYK